MKKIFFLGLGCCIVLAMASCKSSESAYKKAYEKAKQQELAEAEISEVAEVTPVTVPVQKEEPKVETVEAKPVERQEDVELVGDGTLHNFSVVCGSFGLKVNAEKVRDGLVADGYSAMVVFNPQIAMYRVIASSFDDRESAVAFREQFKRRYPDNRDFQESWLLIK
ncbi:MAG TPA: SPOR domain-containing protein [Candidatus Avibacteroides excrementipullorum]|nr:SPOR domain-containing protein [Candidatus Avibacteroides excrementipullorum]